MPKVTISEIDNTGTSEVSSNDFTILIPGPLGDETIESGSLYGTATEGEFTDVATFKEYMGTESSNVSFNMAVKLIELGAKVHYSVIDPEESGFSWTDFFEKYQDKGLYDLRFITCGGYAEEASAEAAIKCAAMRGDAVAILDVPASYSGESGENIVISTPAAVNEYTQLLSADVIVRANGVREDPLKYAAIFSSPVTFKADSSTLPASYDYLSCFTYYLTRFSEWFAFAGSIRGVSPETISSVGIEFGDSDISLLQARVLKSTETSHKATNTIAKIRPYGYVVWGNRTLYPVGEDNLGVTHSDLVASSFLNIRHLCCTIKKVLYRAARQYTFEPNSDVLWTNFSNAITPTLEDMKSGQGIKGYKLIKVATTEKATLKAKIQIIPIEAVEDFSLNVELTDSIEVTE